MRYFRYYYPLAIVALVALATSSTWTTTVDARPLELAVVMEKRQAAHAPEAAAAAPAIPAPAPPHTSAAPEPDDPSPTSNPKPSQPPTSPRDPPPPASSDRPDPPQPTKNPQPTQQPQQPTPPKPVNPNPNPLPSHQPSPPPSSAHSTATNNHSVSPGAASANAPQPTSPTSGMPEDGSEVPTKVSEKVFIGLGAVGGLFLFALGGLTFCRHRKKKNLAAALLEQTAQFNHNNPYAKISEATANSTSANNYPSGKESLPMTPTKPIGTFSVVSDYTPAMPDEIEIYYGDSVTVLQEYDDGWCMGINNSRGGVKGVVPRHCLSGGNNYNNTNNGYDDGSHHGGQYGGGGGDDGYYPPNPGFKAMANKRMSSIPAGGWNNGPGAYQGGGGGYGDYPPPNNSHYNHGGHLGPPGQGYYDGY
ncbi:hypothetical protein BGW39_001844 [Mortierella sp. 14UC]|nr:hypothetical protein BGW39_001844 [Mortierella sp. 14UC]